MGQPKQLLAWGQSTLLRSMATIACGSSIGPVLVVLGCQAERCHATLKGLPVKAVSHEQWHEGMGSSIAFGVKTLATLYPAMPAAIIMQCDQIAVDELLLKRLAHAHLSTKAKAILCRYGPTHGKTDTHTETETEAETAALGHGPPALFSRCLFGKLSRLSGAKGAKPVWEQIDQHEKAVHAFPLGHHDLDTIDQYERYRGDVAIAG